MPRSRGSGPRSHGITRLEFDLVETLDRSTFWPYEDGELGEFYYQRYAHPTGAAAERVLGELDGGEALLFASGAGATTAVVLALLEPGATVAVAEGCYYGTPTLFRELERWGLEHVEFDQTGPPPDGVQLVWLEAPSNPFLTMPDLEAAAAHPAPVLVDATAATPVHLRPLEHGADLVLHAATKYLSGHGDAVSGVVAGRKALMDPIRSQTDTLGQAASPFSSFLVQRGVRTLPLRTKAASANAARIAQLLEGHDGVEWVRYPGLPSHPDHAVAQRLLGDIGGAMVTFKPRGGLDGMAAFTDHLRLCDIGVSLGDIHTLVYPRPKDGGIIRLSIGCEDIDDLVEDFELGLSYVPAS